jgi:phenylpyruvate tautomerase PptA (4-oxalocrotonate tautomerase family)
MAKEKEEAKKQRVIASTTDAMAGVSDADLSMIFGRCMVRQ